MNNKTPYFSVVIPSYNRAHLIKKAIDSVFSQSFRNWELIIADDCSTDNTFKTVKKISKEHSNVFFYQNKVNKGNAGARNLGAKFCRGSYICYLDSDDSYRVDYLKDMKSLIEESNNADFFWCQVNRFNSNNKAIPKLDKIWDPSGKGDAYLYFLQGIGFGTDHGFIVKKSALEEMNGFNEELRTAVDTDFILRLVKNNKKYAFTKKVLVNTFDHTGERVRKNTFQKYKAYKILFQKHKETIKTKKELKSYWYGKLMWLAYHNNKKNEARKYLLSSLRSLNIKSVVIAVFFELFEKNKAIRLHQQVSNKIKS